MPIEEIRLFVERYAEHMRQKEAASVSTAEKIHVDEIASKVAVFYEKVRGVIEYRDVHLLRKNAIERILRRRVFLKDFREDFAEPLVKELIRGGHLPNDAVPETKIADIQEIINNLLALLKLEEAGDDKAKSEISEWLVRMSASSIEEELFPSPEVALLSEMMYGVIKGNLTLKNIPLAEDEVNLQLFVAVQRALFRPDRNQLQYLLLKITHPNWGKFSETELEATTGGLTALKNTIEEILKDPFAPYFLKLCTGEKIIFQLVGDLVFDKVPLDEDFGSSLKLRYDKRYLKIKQQLRRLAFLSVASFLISKILVAFAIEIPLDQLLYHSISRLSLIINIAFPPFLMLLIVAFVKLPSKRNFVLVEGAVNQVVFHDHERSYLAAAPKKKGWFANSFVYLVYGAVLVAILYYVTKWLLMLHFSPASIIIFLLFTSMVTATGVKVKNRAKEMSLEKDATSMWGFLVDLVTVPFMTIGRWTIAGLSQFNILVVAFDFLIELPFQFFVEFLENFRGFIREKKDEIN
jgi:hypothetical protein